MTKKRTIIKGLGPKSRRPVQQKPNTTMKSKKDYRRKEKYGKLWGTISEEQEDRR
jgi:hypothetical protein